MDYNAKIASVRGILETHNSRLPQNVKHIDIDAFLNKLLTNGGTTDEALAVASWDDIKNCGVPDILARQFAVIFRAANVNAGSSIPQNAIGGKYVTDVRAKRLTPAELVELYDPKDADSAVAVRLKELSKNQPFIVFNADGSVDKSACNKLLGELRYSFPPRETYTSNGGLPRQIYRVGERPDSLADVNPLFPSEILRPDGDCANIGRSWGSVNKDTRILIYLARKNHELKVNDLRDAISIHADAITDNSFMKIAAYCPKAALEFDQLASRGELPSLRVSRTTVANGTTTKADPFFSGRSMSKRF
jgi:hypothetical protein